MNDGSSDATGEILEPYTKVLPLTVLSHKERQGYAASVEELLRLAIERTDRPKRDCAILMHADFAHGAEFIPELSFQEAIVRNYAVMDANAFGLCKANGLPIVVFNMNKPGAISRVLQGERVGTIVK